MARDHRVGADQLRCGDRIDAVTAVEFVGPDVVIPIHYDTFPPIETDAEAFKADVESATQAKVVILAPGETHTPA